MVIQMHLSLKETNEIIKGSAVEVSNTRRLRAENWHDSNVQKNELQKQSVASVAFREHSVSVRWLTAYRPRCIFIPDIAAPDNS